MDSTNNTLKKSERLNSKKVIDLLFSKGESFVVYPYRIVYSVLDESDNESNCSMFISVPKKKFKRAVKRNLIRRRVKEAYRLNKSVLLDNLSQKNIKIGMAILYLDRAIREYENLERKMKEVINQLNTLL